MIALALVVVPLVGLFGLAVAIDRVRGVESTALRQLRESDLGADDAPLWAEAVGAVLAVGLTARAGCHVWMAIIGGEDPSLAGSDVTPANAVGACRGPEVVAVDVAGRLFALALGVTMWLLLRPLSMPIDANPALTMLVRLFAVANLGVLLTDPLGLGVHRVAQRRNRSTTHTNARR
jgi:hypothetical protein